MLPNKSSSLSAVSNKLSQLFRQRGVKAKRRSTRRRLLEQLEARQLMAVNILSVTPADGAVNWALDTNLTVRFDTPVAKGQGTINVVESSTGVLGVAVDVNSSNVTVVGDTVTIDLPVDLQASTAYTVLIDDGAFVDLSTATTNNATLLTQDFEVQPLLPFVTQSGGDGTDYSQTPPLNYVFDDTNVPPGGVPEWEGWALADKLSWIRHDDQGRSAFTLGQGTVVVGDPDEFDDTNNDPAPLNAAFLTRPIKLTGVAANSVVLEFDSSFRPENSQVGLLEVKFDNGDWQQLLRLDPTNTSNQDPFAAGVVNANVNEHLVSGTNTRVSSNGLGNAPFRAVGNPASASTMQFRWNVAGGNTWWWALDNIKVKGTLTGVPFLGINNLTTWNLDIPKLSVSISPTSMNENGGTAVGTVTRNGLPTDPLTVTLSSSDTTEATVPATVVIPAGASSVTFPITAVDDLISDRAQVVNIVATAPTFEEGTASLSVLDDEGPKIVSLTPADNASGVDYKSNLTINFDVPIKRGNGAINVFRSSNNSIVATIDVNDTSRVTLAGNTLTVDIPVNLDGLTDYYVMMDEGVVYDTSATVTEGATLLLQNFDALPLRPFVSSTGGDGTDVTKTPPNGFVITGTTNTGNRDFDGWTFVDKTAWLAASAGGGQRASFGSASGVVAVADADLWSGPSGQMDTFLRTAPIDLSQLAAGSAVLEFDASFKSGLPRFGTIEVSYNGGGTWIDLAHFDNSDISDSHIRISSTGITGEGVTPIAGVLNNPTSGSMVFRISLQFAISGWLAIDNLKVTGTVTGLPFQGIADPAVWNFRTAEAPTLTVTIDPARMSENGGTAIGTVSRNLSTTGALVVNLTSSDTTEATVPATVTIPDGAASVTFPITGVDDTLGDGDQVVTITATVTDFFNVPAQIIVQDDDFPKIVSVTPGDNAAAVPVDANLVVQFDQNIKKGNGFVHVIRASDGKAFTSIDIQSPNVTIAGNTVTINPPADLVGQTDYYIAFESGAILSSLNITKSGVTVLNQDFELLPLRPAVTETVGLTPTGTDWTPVAPSGFVLDNSQMPPGGVPEWYGWTFANKGFWQTQGGQGRANFTRGQGTIAAGETDEWDDLPVLNNRFNSFLRTSPIDLSNIVPRSVVFEFDSSFRPEESGPTNNQVGTLDVSYDNGTTWTNVFTYDVTNTSGAATAANVNERKVVRLDDPSTGNPSSGQMVFRFNVTGTNDYWWAVDNLVITASTTGLNYPGIANNDATSWNFTTAEARTLSLTGSVAPIAENGGTVTLTVARNLGTTGDVVVNLASSDPSLATVPATVTIPAGQASATFVVTAVDDANADGLKIPVITATADGFVSSKFNVSISDDEVVDVIVTEIMFNPAGTEPRTEWIEVYNRGTSPADLSGWSIDDEDTTNWGALPSGTILTPGQVGVIYNSFFGVITDSIFRTSWSVPDAALVVGSFWGNLDNSPSAVGSLNENMVLQDAGRAVVDRFNYDDDGSTWPAAANGPSIYLVDTAANNDSGSNWRSSQSGIYKAVNPTGSTFSANDVGSPGRVLTGLYAGVAASPTGVAVRLSRPLNPTVFNLYDQGTTLGAADVTLSGATVGDVFGTVVVDADGRGFTFVPTGPADAGFASGLLPPDTYTLTLRSSSDGLVAADGSQLLGRNGEVGDNVMTFTVAAPAAGTVVVSIPDFVRGFEQEVHVPNTSTGLPVLLSNGNNVGSVEFQVSYNPALLNITGFTSAVAGATVVTDFATAGLAKVRVSSATAFATTDGEFVLGSFTAAVPLTAPYGAKEVLRITGQSGANPRILQPNGTTSIPSLADLAVHVAAFVGDINADEQYDGVDAVLMQRQIVGTNSGSLSYQLADPVLFSDLNVDSGVDGIDSVISQRLVVGAAGPIVPDLPASAGTGVSTPGGPDPILFVPTNLTASAGGTVVVPVRLEVTEQAGIDLSSVSLVLQFDATRFQLPSAASVALAPLLVGAGFSSTVSFSNTTGGIRFIATSASGTSLLPVGTIETLVNVTLNVLPGAAAGGSPFNIRLNNQGLGVGSGNQVTRLNNVALAPLTLVPAPTNGANDTGVDGLITIAGSNLANPTLTVTAPNAVYTGSAYVGASFSLEGAADPRPTVSFTYYAGASVSGSALADAPTNAGTYTVVAMSAANSANNAATSAPVTFNITPKTLTATAVAENKVYDGSTAASVTYSNLVGLVGTETVTVSGNGTFASKDAATGIAVTATAPALGNGTNGGLASNYSLATPSGLTANITPKTLTATAVAENKVYDGSTAASVTYSNLVGLVGTETVTVSGNGTFASKDAATGIAVTATAPALGNGTNGGLASNYSLATPSGLSANITPKTLTATAVAENKVYDGSTAASVTYSNLVGLVGTETVTVSGSGTFASKDAATGIAVTATAPVLGNGTNGGLASNYSLATPSGLSANITPKTLTATAVAENKVYDGSTAASVTYSNLVGLVGTETVTVSGNGTFASKDAATGIAVTATAPALGNGTNGGLASNYSLATPSGLTANITPKTLTATAVAENKVYDGSTAASVTYSNLVGLVGTETVTVSGNGTFASKDAATGIAVTATAPALGNGTNGGLASNYSLATPSGLSANITPKTLTATAVAENKVYDGSTAASVTYSNLVGMVGTETVTVSGNGTFASKDAATGIAVTATAPVLGNGTNGGLASNYSLATPSGLSANITPKGLSVAADAKTKRTGAADPAFTFVASGFVGSETAANALTGALARDPGEAVGSYTIRQGSLAAINGNYDISFTTNTLTIVDAVALVGKPQVNGGAAQRSQLTSLTVTFNTPVILSAGAFSITNIGLLTPENTRLNQSQILVSPDFGTAGTTFTITFGAGPGVVSRGQASGGNSLADGNYRLDIDATKVVDSLGGNLTGSSTFGAAAVDNFFRLFGDADGTGVVDASDLAAWRRAATVYNPVFDANGDGTINTADTDVWRPNYGKRRRLF